MLAVPHSVTPAVETARLIAAGDAASSLA